MRFREVKEIREVKNETMKSESIFPDFFKKLPNEIVIKDGADDLPKEIIVEAR